MRPKISHFELIRVGRERKKRKEEEEEEEEAKKGMDSSMILYGNHVRMEISGSISRV